MTFYEKEALADELLPHLIDRLRQSLPAELREMVAAAAEEPGLDE